MTNPTPPLFRSLGIAASGLDAQRTRMDIAAANIANADVTRTPEGGPYRRKTVELTAATQPQFASALKTAIAVPADVPALPPISIPAMPGFPGIPGMTMTSELRSAPSPLSTEFGVAVRGIGEDQSQGPRVYEPGHPDADADGYVQRSNVRVTDELVEMMDARRLFEANATVFQVAKAMLRRAIDI
jgi:flagellar basal-body rod protein FlgC